MGKIIQLNEFLFNIDGIYIFLCIYLNCLDYFAAPMIFPFSLNDKLLRELGLKGMILIGEINLTGFPQQLILLLTFYMFCGNLLRLC